MSLLATTWKYVVGPQRRPRTWRPAIVTNALSISSSLRPCRTRIGCPTAWAATSTWPIPIVFTVGFDPVQLGLVASFNRPAGNATGVYVFGAEVIPKRLELLREVLPQPGLIAFLVGPQTPATPVQLRQVEAGAQAVGQSRLVLHGGNEDEIDKAFATMAE